MLFISIGFFLKNFGDQVYNLVGALLIIVDLFLHIATKVLPSIYFDIFKVCKFCDQALNSDTKTAQVDLANHIILFEASF